MYRFIMSGDGELVVGIAFVLFQQVGECQLLCIKNGIE